MTTLEARTADGPEYTTVTEYQARCELCLRGYYAEEADADDPAICADCGAIGNVCLCGREIPTRDDECATCAYSGSPSHEAEASR